MSDNARPIFLGRFPAAIDVAGRVQIPPDLLAQVVPGRDGAGLFLVETEIEGIVALVTEAWYRETRLAQAGAALDGRPLTPDREGQIVLPADVAQQLGHAIDFVGVDDRIEVWPFGRLDRSGP